MITTFYGLATMDDLHFTRKWWSKKLPIRWFQARFPAGIPRCPGPWDSHFFLGGFPKQRIEFQNHMMDLASWNLILLEIFCGIPTVILDIHGYIRDTVYRICIYIYIYVCCIFLAGFRLALGSLYRLTGWMHIPLKCGKSDIMTNDY